jgi:hypothetical protein
LSSLSPVRRIGELDMEKLNAANNYKKRSFSS